MTEFTKGPGEIAFPIYTEKWTNADGSEVPANTLADQDTMLFEGNGVTYVYDAAVNSWTDK